jgi:hypothetical protein
VAQAFQACVRSAAAPPALSVAASRFQIDGRDRFLLGISLFDALGQTPPRDTDLDAIASWGIRVVRVWAHWSEPIYAADGTLTPAGRQRLLALVDRLAARGLILELVLLRPGQLPGQRFAVFSSAGARVEAVKAITTALRGRRGILFDLYNEHDHPDGPISHADARVLRDTVKAIDGSRLVTISSTAHHFMDAEGRIPASGQANVRAEVGQEPGEVDVDFLAPHLPRTPDWAAATKSRVESLRGALAAIGRTVPIDLDEETRADRGRDIAPQTYVTAATGAREGGAAGWLFHTAAGFDLGARPFVDALLPAERSALGLLRQTQP